MALDQFDLIPFQVMETWSDLLLQQFLKEAPMGHKRVTLEQLHLADFELFKAMQRLTKKGVRPTSSGARPMEQAFLELRNSPEVRLYFSPCREVARRPPRLGPSVAGMMTTPIRPVCSRGSPTWKTG